MSILTIKRMQNVLSSLRYSLPKVWTLFCYKIYVKMVRVAPNNLTCITMIKTCKCVKSIKTGTWCQSETSSFRTVFSPTRLHSEVQISYLRGFVSPKVIFRFVSPKKSFVSPKIQNTFFSPFSGSSVRKQKTIRPSES